MPRERYINGRILGGKSTTPIRLRAWRQRRWTTSFRRLPILPLPLNRQWRQKRHRKLIQIRKENLRQKENPPPLSRRMTAQWLRPTKSKQERLRLQFLLSPLLQSSNHSRLPNKPSEILHHPWNNLQSLLPTARFPSY